MHHVMYPHNYTYKYIYIYICMYMYIRKYIYVLYAWSCNPHAAGFPDPGAPCLPKTKLKSSGVILTVQGAYLPKGSLSRQTDGDPEGPLGTTGA